MDLKEIRRRKRGSNIAEFGPALFVLLIMMFFPMLDFLGMAGYYCVAAYCNYSMTRELACRTVADGTGGSVPAAGTNTPTMAPVPTSSPVYTTVVTNGIQATSIGAFLGVSPTTLTVQAGYTNPNDGSQAAVTCSTSVIAQPFITVPWFTPIPGLSAPWTITITETRPREVNF